MADYKYSHLGFDKLSPHVNNFKLSKREETLKINCKNRLSRFSWSKLDLKLIWLHIENTSKV